MLAKAASLSLRAQVKSIWPRFHIAAHDSGNQLSALLPRHVSYWLPLLEDVSQSEAFQEQLSVVRRSLEINKEWLYVSLDATMKLCMKLCGQESYRKPKKVRDAAPFGDDCAWRRLLTVRGRSGAVLMLHPLVSEKSELIVSAFRAGFASNQLEMIQYIASDSPSSKLFAEAKQICVNLAGICLDPIHLAIVYEYAQWNKKTAGSKKLRLILKKVLAVNPHIISNFEQSLFTGESSRPLTSDEEEARAQVQDRSMDVNDAKQLLQEIDVREPFQTRVLFIRYIAAICALYPKEVSRKVTGANKEVYRVLWSACAPDRLEWLFNNIRIRHKVPKEILPFLPSGTSSNEALHAEINSWNRSTQALHRSTLELKLRFYTYIKLLAHHLATCFPTSTLTTEAILLARSVNRSLWSAKAWSDFCEEQQGTRKRQSKARLPLATARECEKSLVKKWLSKNQPKSLFRKRKDSM